jgi:hypothetical protein
MAEEQHCTAEVKRRNWVEDTVSWKTHGNPNADTWELPGVQQRRAAVRRFPMVVAWFGQLRLELVRRYGAREMMNVIDDYDVTEWSKVGGNMHKHSINWTVDEIRATSMLKWLEFKQNSTRGRRREPQICVYA